MTEEKKTIQEQIKDSDQQPASTWSAGGLYASATVLLDLAQATDQMVAQLANADDPSPCKKRLQDAKLPLSEKEKEGQFWNDIKGCNPFAQNFANEDDAAGIAAGVLKTLSDILSTTKYDAIACVKEQMVKFFAVIPVQYYLLLLLQDLAKEVGNSKILEEAVQGPCGESIKQTEVFENYLPQLELPRIPPIPYIPIPDLSKIIEQLIIRGWCFTFCMITTRIIREVAEAMYAVDDMFVDFDNGKLPDLEKVDINPYISDKTIEQAVERKLIQPATITTVREFISYIQELPFVKQQEMIFLLMGAAECKILDTILATQLDDKFRTELATSDTPSIQRALKTIRGSKDSSNFTFKDYSQLGLNTDKKIIDFFTFLGTSTNTLDIINDSRANLCLPNVCEVTDENLNAIATAAQKLCALLDPKPQIPPLPMGDLMKAIGADNVISEQASGVFKEEYQRMDRVFSTERSNPYLYDWILSPDNLSFEFTKTPTTTEKENQSLKVITKMAGATQSTNYEVAVTQKGLELGNFYNDGLILETPKIVAEDSSVNITMFEEALKKYWVYDLAMGINTAISVSPAPWAGGKKGLFISPMKFSSSTVENQNKMRNAYLKLLQLIGRELFPIEAVYVKGKLTATSSWPFSSESGPFILPIIKAGEAPKEQKAAQSDYGYYGKNRYPKSTIQDKMKELFDNTEYDVQKQGNSDNDVMVLKKIKEGFLGPGELQLS
tara:strand:- start:14629 stop:16797 length:2169 start_codon:yes stop_codon:yes gene_type:complete